MGANEGQSGVMSHYKVNKEELIKLAKAIYEDGCYGYLDLADATAERAITDFLDGRQIMDVDPCFHESTSLGCVDQAGVMITDSMIHSSVFGGGAAAHNTQQIFSAINQQTTMDSGIRITTATGHSMLMRDQPSQPSQPTLFDEQQPSMLQVRGRGLADDGHYIVREENFVRQNEELNEIGRAHV